MSAPDLYVQFFLKNGKPIQIDGGRPLDSEQIRFTIDSLTPQVVEGQALYELSGWAFSLMDKSISPDMYNRTIVLTSDSNTYFFPVQTVQRSDVQQVFKNLNMDLSGSGFRVLISKDVIQPGEYRIGISFENPVTGLAHYSDKPDRYIIRSANRLSYVDRK